MSDRQLDDLVRRAEPAASARLAALDLRRGRQELLEEIMSTSVAPQSVSPGDEPRETVDDVTAALDVSPSGGDSAGPEGLVPTLLVFGAYPRVTNDSPPSASSIRRAEAVNKAMTELRKLVAKRKINDALNTRNGPATLTTLPLSLAIGSEVRVWREDGGWKGPYKVLAVTARDDDSAPPIITPSPTPTATPSPTPPPSPTPRPTRGASTGRRRNTGAASAGMTNDPPMTHQ